MASNRIRNSAYALHFVSALAWAALPFLGWLRDTGLATHSSVQYWGMILMLDLGLPALIVMLLAVVMSFLVRPPDFALWLMAILLVTFCAAFVLQIGAKSLNALCGLYLFAALGLAIRRIVKARARPAKST